MSNLVKILALAAGTGVAALAATPAAAQDVRNGPNGLEVHYPGPCTVYYDRSGNRNYSTPACNGTQRRMADDAVRARLGNGYGYGYGQSNRPWGWGQGEPIVNINAGGWGTVNLRNGCVVTFNRDGNRINDTQPCNSSMRAYAQQLFRNRLWGGNNYRPQGYPNYGYGNGYGNGYASPMVDMYGNMIRVRMSGTNCTYMYTTGGNHVSSMGSQCDSRLRDIANSAVRDFRSRSGW